MRKRVLLAAALALTAMLYAYDVNHVIPYDISQNIGWYGN